VPDLDPGNELWHGPRTGLARAEALLSSHVDGDIVAAGTRGDALLRTAITGKARIAHDGSKEAIEAVRRAMLGSSGASAVSTSAAGTPATGPGSPGSPTGEAWTRPVTSRPYIDVERMIKSPAELCAVRRACSVTAQAVAATMRSGLTHEAHIAARFRYESAVRGATGMAYPPVVAGGANALCLHYLHSDMQVAEDALVMIDMGADVHMYSGDVSRAWPVSGTFTAAQRDLYGSVLEVHEGCLAALARHEVTSLLELHELSMTLTRDVLKRLLGLSTRRAAAMASRSYPHSIGHHLGLDTHDCPSVPGSLAFAPGMVFTVEPGIYIGLNDPDAPAELRGQGLRIEDDIAVDHQSQQYEILTLEVPKAIDEVEAAVQSAGTRE
jgi:Xaa-Pro aminopeptidase